MTKQEILKEIEIILNNAQDTDELEVKLSYRKWGNISKNKKSKFTFLLNSKKIKPPEEFEIDKVKIQNELLKAFESYKQKEENFPPICPYHRNPYFIPNDPNQIPWDWNKVICSSSGTAVSISDDPLSSKVISDSNTGTGFVKGYNYP